MKLRTKNFKKKSLFIGICLFVLNHCKWVFQFEMENNTNKFTERNTRIHAVAQHIFMSCYMCAQDKKTMHHRHFKIGTASVLCSLRYDCSMTFELCMCGAAQDIFSNCQSTHSDESANAFQALGVSNMAKVCFLVTIWASLIVNSTTKLSWNILGSRLTSCHICTHLATNIFTTILSRIACTAVGCVLYYLLHIQLGSDDCSFWGHFPFHSEHTVADGEWRWSKAEV